MPTGSTWSSETGFNLNNHMYSNIEDDIQTMCSKYSMQLEKQYISHQKASLDISTFKRYFSEFTSACKLSLVSMRFGFFVTSFIADTNQSGTLIIVDTNTSKIEIISSVKLSESLLAQHRLGFLKCVAPDVLNDCVRKRMFNCFGPSKLMRVYAPVAAHYESFVIDRFIRK